MIGSDIIALTLKENKIEYVFDYPGGTVVFILDSIRRLTDIKIITCRHEQSASFAACGYAKSTGKIGCVIATSGPGATNLVTGIADAYFDHIPLLAITGQVPSTLYQKTKDRQTGFQEIDIVKMVEPITVYSRTILNLNLFQHELNSAISTAIEKHGPSLIDLPIDLQRKEL